MANNNRLGEATSPYLRQHSGNPVDWYPWGGEAFSEARRRDVPVLISIGYSACHWCHVMAHESFEDASVAEVLNRGFVAVKVDREERPDVDAVYMEAVQLVSGSGGWPMTVVALPDGRPFWAGTYLPRGRFLQLLDQVTGAWAHKRAAVEEDAGRLSEAIRGGATLPAGLATPPPGAPGTVAGDAGDGALGRAAQALVRHHDPEWGGRAGTPKFPQPSTLEVMARRWWRTGDPGTLAAWRLTLDAMSSGGIYDHLDGGFARYSTDRQWLVPHFEKMLYDNALLLRTYTHAWQLTGSARYRQVAVETAGYLLRPPMRLPAGAWASAEDADSEGEEGRFYTWAPGEVESVAGPTVAEWYGVTEQGNWEGRNVLWRPGLGEIKRPPRVEEGRRALAAHRSKRARPALDGKVLTEWNAMGVAALAFSGAALGRTDWVDAAATTAGALLDRLRRPDGRWLRSWRPDLESRPAPEAAMAYAGDYAWLVEAFVRLAEATGQARWVTEACATAGSLMGLFWDPDAGGFFTSGSDGEQLIARMKDLYDGASPSANSVAAAALARLAQLTGNGRYGSAAEKLVELSGTAMERAPTAFPAMALAADFLSEARREVVVTGRDVALVRPVWESYAPDTVLAWGEPYASPLWEGRDSPGQGAQAFVCQGYRCELPIVSPADLRAGLARPAR